MANKDLKQYPFGKDFLEVKSKLVNLKEIHLYDRSKLIDASFSLKELRDICDIPNITVRFNKKEFDQCNITPGMLQNVYFII